MVSRVAFGSCVASCVLAVASPAAAYCRSTTCPPEQCNPEALVCWEEGEPLYWAPREVAAATASGSELNGISAQAASQVFAQALAAWTSVDCSGSPPSITVASMVVDESLSPLVHGPGSEQQSDDGLDGVNALYFIDQDWPHGVADIALTTTSYRISSGRILESDIEVNSENNRITIGDQQPVVDLLGVLTHEAGHFFGLTHVYEHGPTMFVAYTGDGNLDPRSLEPDDIAGMCAIYPPDRFDDGGCTCRAAGAPASGSVGWLPLTAGWLWLARRRRSRSRLAPP